MQKFALNLSNLPQVPEPLYEAVVDTYLKYGLRKITLEDIARAAGVSRSTIYRQLGSKSQIVQMMAIRELTDLLNEMFVHLDPAASIESWVDYAFSDGLATIRANKVIQKATQDERETLAELVIQPAQSPNIIELTGSLMEAFIQATGQAERLAVTPAVAGRLIVRLLFSLVMVGETDQAEPIELGRALIAGLVRPAS